MNHRRNLIIVLAHGLRSDALGDARAWPLTTPYLEKLADHGIRGVATSACPADWGGMVSLYTGLHARQHGMTEQSHTTGFQRGGTPIDGWPSWLVGAGYHLAGVGCVAALERWMRDSVIVDGVEHHEREGRPCAYLSAMRGKGVHHAVQQQRRQRLRYGPFDPDRLLLEPEDDIDGFIAAEASKMLDRMPTNRPWAMIVAFSGPGNDLPPPPLYTGVVDPEILEEGFSPADFTQIDAMAELDYPRVMLQRLDPQRIGRIRADYLGRVSLIDFGVGRLMSTLETRADRESTWMVVSSDRGQLLGEHGLVGHRSFLAPAIEVPLIIAPPLTGPPLRVAADVTLISTTDLAPSIASLGGCDAPRAVAGRSLLRMLGDDVPTAPACNLSEFGRRLLLETERHKVVFDTETHSAVALYDMLNDPEERENLMNTVTGLNLLDSLRWRLGDTLLPLRCMPA